MFESFGLVCFTPHTKVGEFVAHLREMRLMASRCTSCGAQSFPPRADCVECRSGEFEFVEIDKRARLLSYTTIHAAPQGFESLAPFTLALVEMSEGGRALAITGETVDVKALEMGMRLQVAPRLLGDPEQSRVYYTVEREAR